MSEKVSIKRVVILIGDKEIELTPKEAKELRNILNDTFGEDKTVYVPSSPIIIERPWRTYPYWTVSYKTDTNTAYFSTTANSA